MLNPGEAPTISATDMPLLLPPEPESLFLDRALRLHSLAPGHALQDYLHFMAQLSEAQHRALATFPTPAITPLGHGQPPLSIARFKRDPAWQRLFFNIVDDVSPKAPPEFASRLQEMRATVSAMELECLAQAYLEGSWGATDSGVLTMVAASLQVYWTALSAALPEAMMPAAAASTCPLCDSLPVGSKIRSGAAGLRYLVCSLCASEWHMPRIRCVSCGDSEHVFYYNVDGAVDGIEAETCDSCHTYSKIMHIEKNPALDMVADDLASMTLDILVGEAGYRRFGLNPFLLTAPVGEQPN